MDSVAYLGPVIIFTALCCSVWEVVIPRVYLNAQEFVLSFGNESCCILCVF